MALKVGELFASFNLDSSGVSKDTEKIEKELGNTGSTLTDAGAALSGMTRTMVDWGRELYASGAGFNEQMSTVVSKMPDLDVNTEEGQAQMDAMAAKAMEMAAATKFTTNEAGEAMVYMATAGWDAQQVIDGLPGVMYLAMASGEDLASTSDIVTDSLSAFKLQAADAGHFADVLAVASARSNTNVGLMGETFKECAPLAGTMGYSIEDMSVAIGLMANSGIKGSRAGTAMKNILTRLADPTDEVAAAMDLLGISLDDGNGNLLSFRDVMVQMRTGFGQLKISEAELTSEMTRLDDAMASGSMTETEYNSAVEALMVRAYGAEGALQAQAAATIAGKYGLAGLLAIVNASPEEFEALCAAVDDADGAAEQMAKTMMDNAAGDVAKLASAIDVLKTELWQLVDGPFREVVQGLTEVVNGFNDMDDGTKEGIVKMGVLAAAIGPVLTGAGGLISILPTLVSGLAALVTPLGMITIGMVAMGAALLDSENNIGKAFEELLGTGSEKLAELGVTIEGLDLGDRMEGFLESIRTGAEQFLPKIFGSIVKILVSLMSDLGSEMPAIAETAGSLFETLVGGILEAIPSLLAGFGGLMTAIWEAILGNGEEPGMVSDMADFAVEMANMLVESVTTGLDSMGSEGLVELVNKLVDGIANAIPKVVDAAGSIVGAGFKIVSAIMQSIGSALTNLQASGLADTISGAAVDIIHTLLTSLGDLAENADVQGFMQALGDGISASCRMLGDIMGDIIKYLFSREGLTALLEAGKSLGKLLLEGLKMGVQGIADFFGEMIGNIFGIDYISEAEAQAMYQAARMKDFGETLIAAFGGAVDPNNLSDRMGETGGLAKIYGKAWQSAIGKIDPKVFEMGTGADIGEAIRRSVLDTMYADPWSYDRDFVKYVEGLGMPFWTMLGTELKNNGGVAGLDMRELIYGALTGGTSSTDAGQKLVDELVEPYEGAAEEANAGIAEALDGVGSEAGTSGFATAVTESGAEAEAAALTVGDQVVQTFLMTMSAENGALLGTQFVGGIVSGITEGSAGMTEAAATAAAAAATAAGNAASAAKGVEIGRNFGVGFANGIRSMISVVSAAAAALGSAAAASLGGAIKVGSPSRVTKETGLNFDRGFINGIVGLTDQAAYAARELGSGAANSLQYAAADMGRMASDGLSVPITGRNAAPVASSPRAENFNKDIIDRYSQRIVSAVNQISIVMDSVAVGHAVSGTVSGDIAHGSAMRR